MIISDALLNISECPHVLETGFDNYTYHLLGWGMGVRKIKGIKTPVKIKNQKHRIVPRGSSSEY